MIYGYARISHRSQNIQRQLENIIKEYQRVKIYQEAFTGTKIEGRAEFLKLLKIVKPGDVIVFDSVSRMSRNAEEGTELYFKLMEQGIELIFLKESYINTTVYKNAISQEIQATGHEVADIYIDATNKVLKILATQQIKIAFDQSQKEVDDLRERTKEGLRVARTNGKNLGHGRKTLTTKKSKEAKEIIQKHYKAFGGSLGSDEAIKLSGITRNTFFKYVKEIKKEHWEGVGVD